MVNFWAVLVGSVIAFGIALFWYSPMLFGKQWMKLTKMKKQDAPGVSSMIMGFVSTLILTFVLAIFVGYTGASTFVDGAYIGFLAWLGFIATVIFGGVLWEKMPMQLYWINTLQYLVALIIVGGILAVW